MAQGPKPLSPSALGARSRRKGARFENYIAKLLWRVTGHEFKRNLSQLREKSGRDLETDLPFCIQAKHRRSINVLGSLKEAIEEAEEGEIPIAILRWHNDATVAVLLLDDFLEFLRKWVADIDS